MLYEYLLDTFGTNEPISVSDIKYGGYSRPWIDKELSKLCKSKKIVRYERGIYYIPSQTPFGASVLNPNKIIKYKYIEKCGKINGFYMGLLHSTDMDSQRKSRIPQKFVRITKPLNFAV